MAGWQAVVAALAPSVGVGLLFWWAMSAIVNGDRHERAAQARIEAAAAAAAAASESTPNGPGV